MHMVNAICMQMQCYVWSLSIFASLLQCCEECLIHLLINYFISSTAHMARRKVKLMKVVIKEKRKAIDLEKKENNNNPDTAHNLGSKSTHVKHFQYIPIHGVAVTTEPCFKSWGTYASNLYSLNVIPVISPVMGSSTFPLVNRFHTTVIRTPILDYNYLSLAFQQASCKSKIHTHSASNPTVFNSLFSLFVM